MRTKVITLNILRYYVSYIIHYGSILAIMLVKTVTNLDKKITPLPN